MTDPNLISPFDEHGRFTGPLIETQTLTPEQWPSLPRIEWAPDLRPALKQALDTLHWALGADPANAPGHHARFALDVARLLEASK